MNRIEKGFSIFYWTYLLLYIGCFILLAATGWMEHAFPLVIPFHVLGMLLGLVMLFVVIRDIYKRDFPDPNTKVTWTILILMFMPSILVYLYQHGFRPRPAAVPHGEAAPFQDSRELVRETENPYQSPHGY